MCRYKGLFILSHRWQPACCESHPGNYFASFKVQCGVTLLNLNWWKQPNYHSNPVVLENQQQGKASILLALYGPSWIQSKQINKTKTTIKIPTPNKKKRSSMTRSQCSPGFINLASPARTSFRKFSDHELCKFSLHSEADLHSGFDKAQKGNFDAWDIFKKGNNKVQILRRINSFCTLQH